MPLLTNYCTWFSQLWNTCPSSQTMWLSQLWKIWLSSQILALGSLSQGTYKTLYSNRLSSLSCTTHGPPQIYALGYLSYRIHSPPHKATYLACLAMEDIPIAKTNSIYYHILGDTTPGCFSPQPPVHYFAHTTWEHFAALMTSENTSQQYMYKQ